MGEYEPEDSRNITGTASTRDGRWTNTDGPPPLANGERPAPPKAGKHAPDDDIAAGKEEDLPVEEQH